MGVLVLMMTLRASSSPSQIVTLLVLGAGWTWQFLQPLLHDEDITYAATTSTGHDGTITFRFDSDSDDLDQFKKLPTAQYVLVMNVDMDGAGSKKEKLFGRRWIVADCVSYDWWSLVWEWTGKSHEGAEEDKQSTDEKLQYRRWVVELMDENNVRGLPRSVEALGRKLDARDFWKAIGTLPERTLAR